MAKRTKKLTKSSLKLEALEQRQLLAGVVGGGTEVTPGGAGADKFITHPNGNHYDQVLMTGESVTVTNDAGTVTRVSFLDAEGDIVQAEFSGAGKLTVSLAGATADVAPSKYLQTGVKYMQGTATFTIEGSDASTNFQVFSVGSMTAKTPGLFDGEHLGGNHTADIARITVVADPSMPNGSIMGGIRAGNAVFTASEGVVGITAANVQIQNTVIIGDIDAKGSATPSLVFGATSQFGDVRVTGGDLLQTNGKAIANSNSYLFGLSLEDGTKSDGTLDAKESTAAQITWTGANPGQVQAKSYTLTQNTDTLTGTAGDDVFTSSPSVVIDPATGTQTIVDTLQIVDTVSGGAGTDALNVTLANAGTNAKPILTGIENVNATFNAAATIDLGGSSGVQTVKAVNSTAAANFVGVGAASTLSVANQTQNVSFDGQTATTLALNLTNVGNKNTTVTVDLGSATASKATTLNITSENSWVNVTDTAGANVVTAASVAATGTNKLTLTDGANLGSLTVTGAGSLEVVTQLGKVKTLTVGDGGITFDTGATGLSGNDKFSATTGAGKDTLTVDGSTVKAISTGAGDDKVTTATAALAAASTVDLGAGSDTLVLGHAPTAGATLTGGEGNDTIALTAGNYTTVSGYSDANLAKITGFETLSITGAALANGTSLDVSKIAGVTSGQILGVVTTGTANITNVGANSAVIIKGNMVAGQADGALAISLKDATGASDVLNLTIDQAITQNNDGTVDTFSSAITGISAANVETINFKSTGTLSTDVTGGNKTDIASNTLTLTDNALVTLNISGDQKAVFSSAAGMTKLATVDASTNTAGATVNVSAAATDGSAAAITITGSAAADSVTGSGNADTINAGAGNDSIVGGAGADTIDGGAGNDAITGGAGADMLTGGAGTDTFTYTAAADSTLVSLDVISDFSANTYGNGTNGAAGNGAGTDATKWTGDVLAFDVNVASFDDPAGGVKVSVQGSAADAQTFLQNLAADAQGEEFGVALDSSTGKLYIDLDGNGTADSVIQLTGVTTITAAAIKLV